jgi:hypothetical protein
MHTDLPEAAMSYLWRAPDGAYKRFKIMGKGSTPNSQMLYVNSFHPQTG